MLNHLKKALVGTRLGLFLEERAEIMALRSIPASNPEKAASLANHIIARKLIRGLCPANGCFLDVGAHIGSVFSAVHRANATIRIVAVEADPAKAAFLRLKHPFAEILECAVGEAEGTADFFVYDAQSGYNSLTKQQGTAGARKITVAVRRLDDIFAGGPIDLVKIDVEGAELGVLRGADALVARTRPLIMFESVGLEVNTLGYAPGLIWDWFAARDYRVMTPDQVAHDGNPLSRGAFLDSHQYPFRSHDYFAVPQEKTLAVRDRARALLGVVVGQG